MAPAPGALTGPWPYFQGRWRLARRIADHRRRVRGVMSGEAVFTSSPLGLDYHEACAVVFGGQETRATRCYRFVCGSDFSADVMFEDGRPFHTLDLATGTADVAHACPPDQYRGRYCIRSWDLWTLTWIITGPRKRMVLHTRFTRAGEDGV